MSNLAIRDLPSSSLPASCLIDGPPWCDPALCHVTSTDMTHISHPANWHTLDAEIELNLIRTDEFAFSEKGGTELAFSLKSTSMNQGDGASVYLTPIEARILGYQLLTHADQAEIPST